MITTALSSILSQVTGQLTSGILLDFNPATGVTYDGTNKVSAVSLGSGYTITQATSTKRPIINLTGLNGNPYITFDGVDDVLTMAFNHTFPGITVKAVCRVPEVSSTRAIIEQGLTFGIRLVSAGSISYLATPNNSWNTAAVSATGLQTNTLTLTTTRYQPGLLHASLNANASGPTVSSITGNLNPAVRDLGIGGNGDGNALHFNGDFFRILVWDRYLTNQENTDTDNYLKQKYGLTF